MLGMSKQLMIETRRAYQTQQQNFQAETLTDKDLYTQKGFDAFYDNDDDDNQYNEGTNRYTLAELQSDPNQHSEEKQYDNKS